MSGAMINMLSLFNLPILQQGFVPDAEPAAPPVLGSLASDIISWAKGIGLVAGVLGLIVIGIMMLVGRRSRSAMAAEGLGAIPWVVGGLLLIGMSATIADWIFEAGAEIDEVSSVDIELIDPVDRAVFSTSRARERCLSQPSGQVLECLESSNLLPGAP